VTRVKLLLVSLILLTLSGCATFQKPVTLYPIDKHDIVSMTKGTAYAPEVNGWFVSDFYLQEVMKARVDEAKKAT
jgi:hypothetical protein